MPDMQPLGHSQSPAGQTAPEMVRCYVRYGASLRGAQVLVLGGKGDGTGRWPAQRRL